MSVPSIPPSATIVVADELVASEFGDELVILNLRDGMYYGLENVGAWIWRMVQRPVSVTDVRAAILEEYDIEPDRCAGEVYGFLARLAEVGLIEIRERTE